jgi:TatD DNase family protein
MDLVDTHCHIQSIGSESGEAGTRQLWAKDTDLSAEAVIASAHAHDINRLICVGCDLEDSILAIDFAKDKPECFATIGLHPHEAKLYAHNAAALEQFSALATQDKVVAIGECGLDYFYGHSPKEDQLEVLKFQIELAIKQDLPLIFHVRDAFDDFWPVFEQYEGIRGVLHSFTDNKANLDKALAKGLYIGVNGIATFNKKPEQEDVYKAIPLERLLLETDAPFLTPAPYRGTINEPMRVSVVADFVSNLRHENRESLASQTTDNAIKLFRI